MVYMKLVGLLRVLWYMVYIKLSTANEGLWYRVYIKLVGLMKRYAI